ncbi:MAG: carboxypeptidase regulatory-like domain-containing protein [Cyclobacteriaceae bacterium]
MVSLFLAPIVFISCLEDTIEVQSFGSLSGTVIDSFTDQPISDVEINTNPSSSVVFSDSLGNFQIPEIAAGEYTFTARSAGYEKAFVNATITANSSTEVTIKMDQQFTVPSVVVNPLPQVGAKDQSRNLTLFWETSPALNDTITYNIFVYESNVDAVVFSSLNNPDTFLVLSDLRYETTYFWQVNVHSTTGGESNGEIWNFTTVDFPDNRFLFAANTTGNYQIYSSNDSATQTIQITRAPVNSLHPLYNSDRSEIAFSANPTLNNQIFIMDYKGDNSRQVTTIPIAGFHGKGAEFCWWPDNGGFVYSHYDKLYSIDRHGSNLKLVSTALQGRNFGSCDYNGNTNKIVVQTVSSLIYEGEIYLMNPDGSDTLRIVDDLPGIVQNPTFSIDGKKVIYTQDVSGFDSPDGRQLDSRIFILDLATMVATDISINKPDGTNDSQPRFSPFGSEIIFTNAPNDDSGVKSVFQMETDGTGRSLLFEDAEMPHWK